MLRGEQLGTSLALLPVICLVRGAALLDVALALAATGQRQQLPFDAAAAAAAAASV
jgi:hypothetical protein